MEKIKVEFFEAETKYSEAAAKDMLSNTGKNLAHQIWYFLDTISLRHKIIEHNVTYSKIKEDDGNIILSAIVTAKIEVEQV